MRIALIPLDSRPPSWQFPLRIAQIAGVDLLSPPRELLGTLHKGADLLGLREWITAETRDADATVISWDALVYGGLVQSRAAGNPLPVEELSRTFSAIDWQRCQGYLWLTVPRLGMTIASPQDWELHKQIAEYFRIWGAAATDSDNAKLARQLRELETQIGSETLAQAWQLRQRNHAYAQDALRLAAELGFRACHVAAEDNARTGPHLDELADLRKLALELTAECRREGRVPPRYTFFDGTDECGSLLTARAILDERSAPPLQVRLTLFPSTPSPDQYFGLYESHSLEDGLLFLAKFLGFEYRQEAGVQWLVCFGKQPQPDVFATAPRETFNNPRLLPDSITGDGPLFVADLQACNGGNPLLLNKLMSECGSRLAGLSGWNTNFNALGFSAATLAIASLPDSNQLALDQLLNERILDDYFYQSVKRWKLVELCKEFGSNPLDLSAEQAHRIASDLNSSLGPAGAASGTGAPARISLPWNRLFEVEVEGNFPSASSATNSNRADHTYNQ